MASMKDIGENPMLVLVLLRKYWLLTLVTAMLGLGIALTYNQCATPMYTSSISLLIWNRDIDKVGAVKANLENGDARHVSEVISYNTLVSQSLLVAQRLVPAFKKLINSPMVQKTVEEELCRQNFKKPLKYSFICDIKMNSCIMDIDVTSPDPKLAAAAADALTKAFAVEQERLMHVKYIQAITPALIPESTSWPKKKVIILLGLFAGALLGCAIAFCFEMLDVTIKTSADVKAFELLPLGVIPMVSEIDAIYNTKKFEQHGNLHVIGDAIRVINTTIDFLRVNNPLKVIAVTSALPNSGKTTVSILLARAMGAAQKRVLIIDCDLRKPQLFKKLTLAGDNGLVKFLISPQGADHKDFIIKDVFAGVDVMPNSLIPPNPTELLGSRQFQEMLEQVKRIMIAFCWIVRRV